MDLSRLDLLKKMLVESKDFVKIWDYFMTNFAEVSDFMDLGETTRSEFLEAVIRQGARSRFGEKAVVSNVMTIRLPKERFTHCALQVNDHHGNLFFFEDIGVGLLTISQATGHNDFLRFTAQTPGGPLGRN